MTQPLPANAIESPAGLPERWRVAVLVFVAALVYANTLPNYFAMDDFLYIFNNPAVTNPSIRLLFSATKAFNVFRPVTFASLAVNFAVGGEHAWGYHLANLLLHAAVTLLLYFVVGQLLEAFTFGKTASWVAALLFAVHPIHTEAVASIVGRSELLAAGFVLGAWLLYLRGQTLLPIVCFLLALLAKESALVFVPLLLIGDYARGKFRSIQTYMALTGTAALYLALLWTLQGGRFGEKAVNFLDNPLHLLPTQLRIMNALRVAWKYVGLHVYPASLSCDYSYNAITLYSSWRHLWPWLLATAIVFSACAWALWTGRRQWFLAGGMYLAGFAVTSNVLVPTGTIMGERLAYLPSAGFCLLVALFSVELERRNRWLAWVALTSIVVLLAGRTVVRNRDWHDQFTLFSAAVRTVPGSSKSHAGLAEEYLHRDNLILAEQEFQIAFRIYPDNIEAMGAYGVVESRLGHDEEALRLFRDAVTMTDKNDYKYDFQAVTLAAQLMKMGQNDQALKILDERIEASPGYSRAWSNRAAVQVKRGELTRARQDALTALRLDAANDQARNVLALLHSAATFEAR